VKLSDELVTQIDALLDLDSKGCLVPHGVGGLAREVLARCRARLVVSDEMVVRACSAHEANKAANDEWVSRQGMRAALEAALG
jgi:hypothetical protein